jgi:general secretion pathway protein G
MWKRKLSVRVAANGQRGMTLLEIIIVLAIIALVMAVLVGPRVFKGSEKSEKSVAKMEAKQFAYEAYNEWHQDTRKSCPGALSELLEYMNKKDTKDPWGNEWEMLCGADKMPGASKNERFGVHSNGPDGVANNEDDIKSWE